MALLDDLRRAMDSEARATVELRNCLNTAFLIHPDDLPGDYASLEAVVASIVEAASRCAARHLPQASDRAESEVIGPYLEASKGLAKLGEGWEDVQAGLVARHLRQSAEELELARTTYLTQVRHRYEEAEAVGWSAERVRTTILDDVQRPGAMFGRFRSAVRKAVVESTGMAWTATWTAAFASLQVSPSLMRQAREHARRRVA